MERSRQADCRLYLQDRGATFSCTVPQIRERLVWLLYQGAVVFIFL